MSTAINRVFLFREKHLKRVQRCLVALRSGEAVSHPVMFFYGPTMVGKSTLLRKIKQEASNQLIPAALIDFDDPEFQQRDFVDLARKIMYQLKTSGRQLPPEKNIFLDDSVSEAVEKLLIYARQLRTSAWPTPVALFFDTLEQANSDVYIWLQKQVLLPLLRQGKTFIVLASRKAPRELTPALDFGISSRVEIVPLESFSLEQTKQHLQKLFTNTLKDDWQKSAMQNPIQFTGGIPGLNEQLVIHPFDNSKEARSHLVENVIFKLVATGNLKKVEDEIVCMAAFRHFHNKMLARVVHYFWPKRYPEESSRAGLKLARKMRATTLVERHSEGYGHVVLPASRQLIDDYARDKNLLRHFDTHILGYHYSQQDVVEGDFVALLNQLYHLAGVWTDWETIKFSKVDYPKGVPLPNNREDALCQVVMDSLIILKTNPQAENLLEKVINSLDEEANDFLRFLKPNELKEVKLELKKTLKKLLDINEPLGGLGK